MSPRRLSRPAAQGVDPTALLLDGRESLLRKYQELLAEQEHLRALGEMASGVAHDLNNTLNSMKLRLELLERDTQFAARNRSQLDALVRIVSDATTRLCRLQDFARQHPETLSDQVQLGDVIHEAVEIARSDLEHRAAREGLPLAIEVEVPRLPRVNGSATDLRYVFINLLLNARDAMPHGGTIRIRGTTDKSHVVITVEDEGTGIPEPYLRSIFRPFFTTKGDKGTGLGLSMAYGVMSRAGGSITAANRREGGAVFTLSFPMAGAREGTPKDSTELAAAPLPLQGPRHVTEAARSASTPRNGKRRSGSRRKSR